MKTPLLALEFRLAEAVNHVAGAAVSVFNYCTARDAWAQYAAMEKSLARSIPHGHVDNKTGNMGGLPEYLLDEQLKLARSEALELNQYSIWVRYAAVLSVPVLVGLGSLVYASSSKGEQAGSTAWLAMGGAFLLGVFGMGILSGASTSFLRASVNALTRHSYILAQRTLP